MHVAAQVHAALGKLALSADNRGVAGTHFLEALQSYVAALRTPEALGTLRDRSDIRSAPHLMHASCVHSAMVDANLSAMQTCCCALGPAQELQLLQCCCCITAFP